MVTLSVQFIVNMDKSGCVQTRITYKKYRDIDMSEFKRVLLSSRVLNEREGLIDAVVEARIHYLETKCHSVFRKA